MTFVLALARFGVVLLIAIYLQAAHGWTAGHTGLIIIPAALGMMITAPVAARLARHFSARILSTAGLALTSAGMFYLAAVLDPHTGTVAIAFALTVIGVGSGLFMTPNTSSIMASVAAGPAGCRQWPARDAAEHRNRDGYRPLPGDRHQSAEPG